MRAATKRHTEIVFPNRRGVDIKISCHRPRVKTVISKWRDDTLQLLQPGASCSSYCFPAIVGMIFQRHRVGLFWTTLVQLHWWIPHEKPVDDRIVPTQIDPMQPDPHVTVADEKIRQFSLTVNGVQNQHSGKLQARGGNANKRDLLWLGVVFVNVRIETAVIRKKFGK